MQKHHYEYGDGCQGIPVAIVSSLRLAAHIFAQLGFSLKVDGFFRYYAWLGSA